MNIAFITSAVNAVKKAYEVSINLKNVEITGALSEALLALADAKVKCADLIEENLRLQGELKRHTDAKLTPPTLENGAYYFTDPSTAVKSGPYCTACFDTRKQRIVLNEAQSPFDNFGKWKCNVCKAFAGKAT